MKKSKISYLKWWKMVKNGEKWWRFFMVNWEKSQANFTIFRHFSPFSDFDFRHYSAQITQHFKLNTVRTLLGKSQNEIMRLNPTKAVFWENLPYWLLNSRTVQNFRFKMVKNGEKWWKMVKIFYGESRKISGKFTISPFHHCHPPLTSLRSSSL